MDHLDYNYLLVYRQDYSVILKSLVSSLSWFIGTINFHNKSTYHVEVGIISDRKTAITQDDVKKWDREFVKMNPVTV